MLLGRSEAGSIEADSNPEAGPSTSLLGIVNKLKTLDYMIGMSKNRIKAFQLKNQRLMSRISRLQKNEAEKQARVLGRKMSQEAGQRTKNQLVEQAQQRKYQNFTERSRHKGRQEEIIEQLIKQKQALSKQIKVQQQKNQQIIEIYRGSSKHNKKERHDQIKKAQLLGKQKVRQNREAKANELTVARQAQIQIIVQQINVSNRVLSQLQAKDSQHRQQLECTKNNLRNRSIGTQSPRTIDTYSNLNELRQTKVRIWGSQGSSVVYE